MQTLLTRKTISMTELREPAKVFNQAGDSPIAILNRNQVIGYFVPVAAVENIQTRAAGLDVIKQAFAQQKARLAPALVYLRDK
ncbi:prevent-host-death family protein [Thiothrix subterranea]|uniref:prevent-host-death family protein n=1 Tax=Thiothrix subterranea TaxID=2735563 RepID=UPI00192CE32C|nr:prevent-host-death family protein [Thiothrix subterranea]QQZ28565.1 prevent-host-death family protein [Thiothrix subterranea]